MIFFFKNFTKGIEKKYHDKFHTPNTLINLIRMKSDILLAGVGGQGILSIAAAIGTAALKENLYIKQSEVHGMSQRGGAVQSHVRLSDQPVSSDLIPQGGAQLILSMEPMEALRYLSYLNPEGWLITNNSPYKNISNYPDEARILRQVNEVNNQINFDAKTLASELKANRSINMIMLGAASLFLPLSQESLEEGIKTIFLSKGESVIETNIKAFRAGKEKAGSLKKA